MGELYALFAALGFTFQFIWTRRGLMEERSGNAWEVNFIVFSAALFAFCIGIIIATFTGFNFIQEFYFLNLLALLLLLIQGILGSLVGSFLVTIAIAQIGAAHTSAIVAGANPLFTTIFAVIILGEKPPFLGIIAVLMIISGITVVGYRHNVGTIPLFKKTKIKGGFFALISGLSYSLSQIARGAAINQGATPNTALLISTIATLVIIAIICTIKSRHFNWIKMINTKSLYYYSGSGIGALVGSYALLTAFTIIPVWQAIAIRNIQPLLAVILARILLKKEEIINLRLVLGAMIVTIGVVILNIIKI